MKKNEFFEWIKRFNIDEKDDFKRRTKALVVNQRTFIRSVVDKIQTWQFSSKANKKNFPQLLTKIRKTDGRKFTKGNFHDAVSRLKFFLYEFIIINEVEKDELLKYQIIFKAVQKRHFSDTYFYYLDERKKANEAQPHKSFDYYHEKSTIDYLRYFNAEFQKYTFKTTQNYTDFYAAQVLSQTWQNNQTAFLIKQFRVASEIICFQTLMQDEKSALQKIDFSFLNQQLVANNLPESLALNIYANIYQCFVMNDFSNMKSITPIIEKTLSNINIFTNEEQNSLLILLMNLISKVKKINPTDSILQYLERIALTGFENNIFGKESSIEENVYINLHSILKKHPLRHQLEGDLLRLLPTDNDRLWVKTHFEIQKHMEEKQLYKALQRLQELKHHNNIRFTFRKYIYQLMCMLELKLEIDKDEQSFLHQEEDLVSTDRFQDVLKNIDYAMDSKYLQKPTKDEKEKFQNYVKVIALLYQKNIDSQQIQSILESDTAIYAKDWLILKFNEISNQLK